MSTLSLSLDIPSAVSAIGGHLVGLTIDGVDSAVKNWREVYVALIEAVHAVSKLDQVKSSWLRDTADAKRPSSTPRLSFGKHLDMNIDRAEQVKRCSVLTGILGLPVSVDIEKDAKPVQANVVQFPLMPVASLVPAYPDPEEVAATVLANVRSRPDGVAVLDALVRQALSA